MTVDQIMVRKVGGWNMITPAEWRAMNIDEQRALLSQQAVKFYSQGEVVGLKEAIVELKPVGTKQFRPETPPEAAGGEPDPADIVEVEPVSLAETMYARHVVPGPAWLVTRAGPGEEPRPLWAARSREEQAYDLESSDGHRTLMCDLIADSFGLLGESLDLFSIPALEHFGAHYFDKNLGDGFWEVTSYEIRAHISSSPFFNVLNLR